MRTKRLCRVGVGSNDDGVVLIDDEMFVDEEQSVLEEQTLKAVNELKLVVAYQYDNFKILFSRSVAAFHLIMIWSNVMQTGFICLAKHSSLHTAL